MEQRLSDSARRTLRPLTVEEIGAVDSQVIEFGAHGHTHCILGQETRKRREEEIRTSVDKVSQWVGRRARLFSFPNGQRQDFNQSDKAALREAGVEAAVSGIAGANGRGCDLLELRRYPVGIHHTELSFRAEVTGLRSALLTVSGRAAS